ncbi:roadblock/LC7 domain-containing protein [Streptomyces sp. WAC 01325]|uniref:Roadblock/LC7 domain-containing protein n=2 Tax=Streptomyces TaxID=1883 RepID=A0A7H8TJS1_STRCX|nr:MULTISPECIES: roadblock/LC7 domain-containing protein [Streptomyces]MCZ4603815.1 roadblock/LC7 domain-containing protein [Streptomyces sp. Lzd4kr]MBT1094645.1 roadblock/LC7 domain-containing protein [Streptomyces sp. Tu102]QEV72474.1 roadblock/LC7 domain-containing protein [Streptomyces chartreusis]QKZ23759.1 roadblock/LC7 domain-containing protein [Streptomyces chartreusis]RSN17339.1 roadblock/LC7 domain-containing protein [Streptomyces sp. WAC 01325]
MTSREAGDTAWVLEPILEVPHVVAAVLLTRDGLVTGYTDALTQPSAERVAAITSTVQGACRTAAAAFADRERAEVRQVVIESDHGYVLIVPTDHGSCVAAYGDGEVRLDMLAHRVHSQVARLGEKAMAAAPRGADGGASA